MSQLAASSARRRRKAGVLSETLPSGPLGGLFFELCVIDPGIPEVLDRAVDKVFQYEPLLFEKWRQAGVLDRVGVYAVHYLTPFYGLITASEDRKDRTDRKSSLLAAQLMSGMAWRAFDNAVDGHVAPIRGLCQGLEACIDLIRFVTSVLGVPGPECAASVLRHYQKIGVQADRERREAVPIDEIWTRCSVLLYAPADLASLNRGQVALFCDYINFVGLAHDLSDLVGDLGGGVVSLPVQWLAEESHEGGFDAAVVARVWARAREAVGPIEDRFARAEVAKRYPLLNRLLSNAREVFDGRKSVL